MLEGYECAIVLKHNAIGKYSVLSEGITQSMQQSNSVIHSKLEIQSNGSFLVLICNLF